MQKTQNIQKTFRTRLKHAKQFNQMNAKTFRNIQHAKIFNNMQQNDKQKCKQLH